MIVIVGTVNQTGCRARVGDAGQLTGINHLLDALFIGLPVLEEDTGRARHGKHIGIGGLDILFDGVLRVVGVTVLRVVVLDKGHRIATIIRLHVQTTAVQTRPIVVIHRVAHSVTEGEVKGGTLHHPTHLGSVDPGLHGTQVAVPILAHRIGRRGIGVIQARVAGCIALGHVVAETRIAKVIEQHAQVGLDRGLHVAAGVIQVAQAAPVLTAVVVGTQRAAVAVGPVECGAAIVVAADVGGQQAVSRALIGLGRERHPVVDALAVVEDHVGDGADALAVKGADHRQQFRLVAKRTVVNGEPVLGVIAH